MPTNTSLPDEPREWLKRAIREVSVEHLELWTLQAGERARVSHIFARLRSIVPSQWDVDSEWNRQGTAGDPKFLVSPLLDQRYGIPDIIIHRRGKLGPRDNLLIAEFKMESGSLAAESTDYEKVSSWMRSIGYQFGAVVSLGESTPDLKLMWRAGIDEVPEIESF